MKNQYAKFIKYLEKQENIRVQRDGDSVYLTDGKVALMLPVFHYNNMVRPLSGLLPDLENDCTGEKRPSDFLVTIRPDGFNIKKALAYLNTEKVIRKSQFLVELPPVGRSKKPIPVRIFKADNGDIIGINEVFVDIFNDLCLDTSWRGDGRWNSPIVQKTDDFMLVAFPVKIDQKFFEIWNDAQ